MLTTATAKSTPTPDQTKARLNVPPKIALSKSMKVKSIKQKQSNCLVVLGMSKSKQKVKWCPIFYSLIIKLFSGSRHVKVQAKSKVVPNFLQSNNDMKRKQIYQ